MIGGRSALLAATNALDYGNWLGNYSDVSLLLRNGTPGPLVPLDESPTPKTITAVGNASVTTAIARWNQGSGGSSLAFDGNGDQFTAANINANNADLTIECWLRLNAYPPSAGIIACTYSGTTTATQLNTFIFYVTSTGTVVAGGAFGGGATTATIPLNTWVHVAFVYTHSNQTRIAYLNGVASAPYSGESLTNTTVTSVFIGGSSGALNIGTWWLNGYIDDLRITKGVARYTSDFTPPTDELPANITDDPSYNSVSLLLRNGTPSSTLVPLDESPTPKNLNIFGSLSATSSVFKYGSYSLLFNGGHIRMNGETDFAFGTGDFTWEFWIYFLTLGDSVYGSIIVDQRESPGAQFMIFANSTNGFAYRRSVAISSNTALNTNQWYHFALTRQNSVVRMFVNGRQVGSVTDALNVTNSGNRPIIGGDIDGPGSRGFTGFVDDLRVTKGIARYTRNFLPPPAELPAI